MTMADPTKPLPAKTKLIIGGAAAAAVALLVHASGYFAHLNGFDFTAPITLPSIGVGQKTVEGTIGGGVGAAILAALFSPQALALVRSMFGYDDMTAAFDKLTAAIEKIPGVK